MPPAVMRSVVLVLSLAAAACEGSDAVTPGPPGPTIPSIGGTYLSQTMWQFERRLESDGSTSLLTCAGGLTIASQLGQSFSGTFFINDPTCGGASGNVNSGTLGADGSVTFELSSSSGQNFLTAAFGCTYISGDTALSGTISGNSLQAQSSTLMNCPSFGGDLTLTARASGSR